MKWNKYNKRLKIIVCIVVITLVFIGQILNLTYDKPRADQRQNLAYAYNTLKYGIFDQTSSDNPAHDYRREPVYPFVLMVSMVLNPTIDLSVQNARCITLGKGCLTKLVSLKLTNVLILILTALMSAYIVYVHCNNYLFALICFFMVSMSGASGFFTNTFYAENFTALIILAFSYVFYLLIKNKYQLKFLIFLGILLGLLALTKAIFFYFIIIGVGFIFFKSQIDGNNIKYTLKYCSIVFVVSMCLISPWMFRNYIQLGAFSMAGGSGVVMITRANYNDMSDDDHLKFILLNLRGLGNWIADQLSIELDRELLEKKFKKKYKYSATKFRRTIRKEERLSKRNPKLNEMMFQSAKDRILNNLSNHISMTIPILIRGSFPEIGYGFIPNSEYWYHGIEREKNSLGVKYFNIDVSKLWVSLPTGSNLIYFIAFWLSVLLLIIKKKWDIISFLIPSIYLIMMYTIFTHFIPRYSVPLIPVFVICFVVLIHNLFNYLRFSIR